MLAPAPRMLIHLRFACAALLASTAMAACAPAQDRATAHSASRLHLERVASGLEKPVHVTAPAGDARLFIVEQTGRIRILVGGKVLAAPFLDLSDRVSRGYERGLLSVAFHPQFARNRFLFVNYTDRSGDTRIERFRVGEDPNQVDPATATLVLHVPQPYSNHNGGHIVFGPDGMLYVGMGDGGSGGDPQNHGQNLQSLLGKLLRLDIDRGSPYAIPPDNPFKGDARARAEIWAYGLRNPWRFAFDPKAGLVFIGDVGQNAWEEIDVAKTTEAGVNYGWARMEGRHCFRPRDCDPKGTRLPVVEYPSSEGCTVIGGLVYRGARLPALAGHYFYADHCRGWIRSFRYLDGRAVEPRRWTIEMDRVEVVSGERRQASLSPSSFGTDGAGELHVVSLSGEVYRVVPGPATPGVPRR